jgi:hypothetical protein
LPNNYSVSIEDFPINTYLLCLNPSFPPYRLAGCYLAKEGKFNQLHPPKTQLPLSFYLLLRRWSISRAPASLDMIGSGIQILGG